MGGSGGSIVAGKLYGSGIELGGLPLGLHPYNQ